MVFVYRGRDSQMRFLLFPFLLQRPEEAVAEVTRVIDECVYLLEAGYKHVIHLRLPDGTSGSWLFHYWLPDSSIPERRAQGYELSEGDRIKIKFRRSRKNSRIRVDWISVIPV